MRFILLSGGSGKRLWPLSNTARSKQFLKVLTSKNGKQVSMVQRVWNQLANLNLNKSTLIATSKVQAEILKTQLGEDIELVIEPCRRDTFPAIALACTYLYTVKKIDLEEVVGVLPVDPYVDDEFFEKVANLENILLTSESDLALLGVKPLLPTSKYGYIVPKNSSNKSYLEVDYFVEKPPQSTAKELIKHGSLWNCGVFAFKLKYLINVLKEKNIPTDYYQLIKNYNLLPKISFDYEVVEKTKNIVVTPYNKDWKDLGTWNTLTEEMTTNQLGKGKLSEDSINTHLINELDIPVVVLGIQNAVVAVSSDGVLVADKNKSPQIKDFINDYEYRPMYEERLWGWYRVLDFTKHGNGNEVLTKRIYIKKGRNLSYHYHNHRTEIWAITKGEGLFAIDGKLQKVRAGDVLRINSKEKHSIKAITDLEIIEVQTGNGIVEEDIVRLLMTWEEIEKNCNEN